MATRLYLPSSGTAPASPSFGSPWGVTTSTKRLPLFATKQNTSLLAVSGTETSSNAFTNMALAQFVSEPLAADATIAGTMRAVISGFESSATADMSLQVAVLVYSSTNVLRGTLFSGQTTETNQTSGSLGQELALSASTRIIPDVALTSVDALAGDRIAVTFGVRARNAVTTAMTATLTFGDPVATPDYALVADSTATGTPWVEFSDYLPLPGVAASTTPVEATQASSWNTYAPVTATQASSWTVRTPVTATQASSWTVRTPVTATQASSWNTHAGVQAALEADWETLVGVAGSVQTLWDDAAALTAAQATQVTTWAVRAARGAVLEAEWAILTPLATSVETGWALRAAVGATLDAAWLTYAVTEAATEQRWDATVAIETGALLRWTVREASGVAEVTTRWATLEAVLAEQGSTWGFSAVVSTELALTLLLAAARPVVEVADLRLATRLDPVRVEMEVA